jgi:hypothetical protein
MLLPPPLVVSLDYAPATAWTSYLTPMATWPAGALPVTLGFSGSVPGLTVDGAGLLRVAMAPWLTVDCTSLRMKAAASSTALGTEAEDGRNDVLVHTTDWPAAFTVGAAGQTVLYVRGGAIVEADVHLNARDYAFALGASPGRIDVQSVLTHELGHVVGIGHSEVARATMNAGLASGIGARSLERDDVDAVCALYPGANPEGGCASDGCPSGWTCEGKLCQRPAELGVAGHGCGSGTRPCEGAGDAAECVPTDRGSLCGVPCPLGGSPGCGLAMRCVAALDGAYCLPDGASPVADAGVGADAGPHADTGSTLDGTASSRGGDGGCAYATRPPRTTREAAEGGAARGQAATVAVLGLTLLYLRQRRRAQRADDAAPG